VGEIIAFINKTRALGKKLVVLPELCTCDYMLGDRWEVEAFLRDIEVANEEIRKATIGIIAIWGSVRVDWDRVGEDERVRKYNAAMIACNGEWVKTAHLFGWIPKTNLPKYGIFDDARHFYPASSLAAELGIPLEELLQPFQVRINGKIIRLALTICEDLWEDGYSTKVSKIYRDQDVDLIIDISQSPWTTHKLQAREKMLRKRTLDSDCPILYVNVVGLQNNAKNLVWFDGTSCLMGADGVVKWRAPRHKAGLFSPSDFSLIGHGNHSPSFVNGYQSIIEDSHTATIEAMRDFYRDYSRIVIGLSGGIDSAISLAMHVEALGASRVVAINMPTQFNSQTTRSLAALCAENFRVEYKIVPIQQLYEAELKLYAESGDPNPSSFDRENFQARLRGHVLAAQAAMQATKLGGRTGFTCNGNKTEVALNYFTLYGDGAGCSAFFADYWKGEMYALARLINGRAGRDIVPQGIIDIVPSAELSSAQNVDEGKGDPIFYPYHDRLLAMWLEGRMDPTAIMRWTLAGTLERELGCADGIVAKYFRTRAAFVKNLEWAWRQYSYEGKRHMLPPGLIRTRAFGFDRRETIADAYFTREYKTLRDEYLRQTP